MTEQDHPGVGLDLLPPGEVSPPITATQAIDAAWREDGSAGKSEAAMLALLHTTNYDTADRLAWVVEYEGVNVCTHGTTMSKGQCAISSTYALIDAFTGTYLESFIDNGD